MAPSAAVVTFAITTIFFIRIARDTAIAISIGVIPPTPRGIDISPVPISVPPIAIVSILIFIIFVLIFVIVTDGGSGQDRGHRETYMVMGH